MKNLPYFRWYPADAETDAAYSAMTWAERGFYHWCLNYAWINDGLPADLNELARVAKMPRREMDKLWPRVGSRFAEDSGVLRNPRQEEERNHAVAKSRQSSKAVEAREAKRKVRSSDDTSDDHPRAYDCGSDSSSEKGSGEKPIPPVSRSEYPLTIAEIRKREPATDDMFVLKLVQIATQKLLSDDSIPPCDVEKATTDRYVSKAVEESFASFRAHGNSRHGAGLLLTRVPNILQSWCKETS